MNATTKLRLQQRAPLFDGAATGGTDEIAFGIEAALRLAVERATKAGQRQVVTRCRYWHDLDTPGLPAMRVQAWR